MNLIQQIEDLESKFSDIESEIANAREKAQEATGEADSAQSSAEEASRSADGADDYCLSADGELDEAKELLSSLKDAVQESLKTGEDTKARLAAAKSAVPRPTKADFKANVLALWAARGASRTRNEAIAHIASQLYVEFEHVNQIVIDYEAVPA